MQAKYQLKTAIGNGSYGRVYEATLNNEPVAAKVLHPTLIHPAIVDKFREECELSGAPNGNFRENICSEDDLRARIFGTFVVKFLACLLLL